MSVPCQPQNGLSVAHPYLAERHSPTIRIFPHDMEVVSDRPLAQQSEHFPFQLFVESVERRQNLS